jgi:hypothetical protein
MDESHLEAEHAAPRRLVDQLGACVREMREGRLDVVHLVRDVVHSRAALCEEATNGRIRVERAEQFEPALADADGRRLDALLLHTRAVLELRAEQALVGLDGAVEILDRDTNVMHRAGRLHLAIVFERLAPTMRASALALVLTAAFLTGCGGSGSSTTAKSNGEASKPAGRVLADAEAAATNASSAHISGNITSGGAPITVDLTTARGKGGKGSMSTNGLKFDLVRIGDTVYVRGTDAFYKHFAGAAVAQLLHNKWLKGSATHGRLKSLAELTNLRTLFARINVDPAKIVNDGKATYKGQQVVALRSPGDNSKLYVAATGKPYPVAIVGNKQGQSGAVTFDDWNKSVSLSAPNDALDISQFGG